RQSRSRLGRRRDTGGRGSGRDADVGIESGYNSKAREYVTDTTPRASGAISWQRYPLGIRPSLELPSITTRASAGTATTSRTATSHTALATIVACALRARVSRTSARSRSAQRRCVLVCSAAHKSHVLSKHQLPAGGLKVAVHR